MSLPNLRSPTSTTGSGPVKACRTCLTISQSRRLPGLAMDQVLRGDDDGSDLFARAGTLHGHLGQQGLNAFWTRTGRNWYKSIPRFPVYELQTPFEAKSICAACPVYPAIILTGISPTANASSDGEIRIFYDWIAPNRAYWREPLEVI